MPRAERNPLVICRERQRQLGMLVPAEGAVDGDEPVTEQLLGHCGRERACNSKARDANRKSKTTAKISTPSEARAVTPVLVAHVPKAQVSYPRAPYLTELRQRRAVRADAQQHIDQIAPALEGRSVMWRTDAHHPPK